VPHPAAHLVGLEPRGEHGLLIPRKRRLPTSHGPRPETRDLQNGVSSSEIPDHSNSRSTQFSQIEELGEMRDKGYVTEAEFQAKKAQLLASI